MGASGSAVVRPRLIVFAGLPGSGKSTIVDRVAAATGIPVLSVDPIEEGMHRAGVEPETARGLAAYLVAARVAEHLLGLDQRVMIEACNAEPEGRETWDELARRCAMSPFWIEVRCADLSEHRRRLAGRITRYPGVEEPTWEAVQARASGLAEWDAPRLVIDSTAGIDSNVARLVSELG